MSDRIHKELVAAVGKVLAASPNLPGWKSAWDRLEKAHKAALALLPDPPGECCRRAAEAMRNRTRDHFIRLGEPHLGEIVGRLPLPGAKAAHEA